MNRKNGAVLTALERVQRFLDDNAALMPAANASPYRKTLDDAIARLGGHAVDQNEHTRLSAGARAKQLAARRVLLRVHMRRISTIARVEFPRTPEFAALKAAPTTLGNQALVHAAESMANLASQHAEVFEKGGGLPPQFVDELRAAAAAVKEAAAQGQDSRSKRTGATKGVRSEAKRGRDAVAVLDTFVEPALKENEPLLREWKSRRQVVVTVRPPAQDVGGAPAPTPVPQAA
jgi:hypothetical protein